MQFIGFSLVIFGVIIFINPDIIAYIVSAILILVGGNILLLHFVFKRGTKESIKFGSYEIFRNKR